MIEDAAERIRLFWASVVVIGLYAFTILSLHFLTIALGRPRAYHRTIWMLGHLTEWFGKTGRHRKAEGQAEGEKAEG